MPNLDLHPPPSTSRVSCADTEMPTMYSDVVFSADARSCKRITPLPLLEFIWETCASGVVPQRRKQRVVWGRFPSLRGGEIKLEQERIVWFAESEEITARADRADPDKRATVPPPETSKTPRTTEGGADRTAR
ncbi:hypothetical protein EYF80_025354 [Liparis tanakae]|uniref:Uncharacterized protein n=1 Tax=Liparis tanakae TaxID=230148 RepID=A0A4Z2HHM5_9TELE|nr:hypothetical protein EYF80_025354 [Liparis tanakae]